MALAQSLLSHVSQGWSHRATRHHTTQTQPEPETARTRQSPGPWLRADITWSMADRQVAPEPRAGAWRVHQGLEETGFAGRRELGPGLSLLCPFGPLLPALLADLSPAPEPLPGVRQLRPCLGRKGADVMGRVPLSRSGFPHGISGVSSFSPSNPVGL